MISISAKPWTREELILAINLYCSIPFGRIHVRNPQIVELANLLKRTPGSVSYKLANFASIDPTLDRKGAGNVSRLDREVWGEFFDNWDDMVFESERKFAEAKGRPVFAAAADDWPEGATRETVVKTRVNQQFFRRMIIASYDGSCCITGMCVPELLVASHIVPWSLDVQNRMNPTNGLCLNALHDKAFDAGLITIDDSYRVIVSPVIRGADPQTTALVCRYDGQHINLPSRFLPDQQFLHFHRANVFRG